MVYVCLKIVGSKIPWDSIEVGKDSRRGGKGDSLGSAIDLCDCGWHIHPSGGGNEECNS
jgi:hypothetical protein